MKGKNNKNNEILEKSDEEEEKEDKEYFYEEDIEKIINSNNIINNEELNINLSSPIPNFPNQYNNNQKQEKEENIQKSIIFNEILEIEYEDIPYRLFIYIKVDKSNVLNIELIPKEGHLPHSYRNTFDEKTFYKINPIFMELKTIEKIGKKIVSLFNKNRVSLSKDKNEDLFYLILKITIIDEDKEILLTLNKNDNIQVSTINYLLREAKQLKNDFTEYKSNKYRKQLKDMDLLKKENEKYLNIIYKIKNENKNNKLNDISDDDEEDNKNKIINNENNNKDNMDIDDDNSLEKISKMIIEQNDRYKKMIRKMNKMENSIKLLTNNFKCDARPKTIILNVDINDIKPYILIHFEIKNIGIFPLNNKYDDIYCNIEGISPEIFRFLNSPEKYIYLNQDLFPPNQTINVCKKFILNNATVNTKYEFYINIFSSAHGKISQNPIKVIIYIRKKEEELENFISILYNKKLDFDIRNKKIIFEYFEEDKFNENNKNSVDVMEYKKRIKIYKYSYDNKSGLSENKDEEKDIIDAFVVINKEDINKILSKIYDKYKEIKKVEKYIIEDIICTCAGDFQKICDLIESKGYK